LKTGDFAKLSEFCPENKNQIDFELSEEKARPRSCKERKGVRSPRLFSFPQTSSLGTTSLLQYRHRQGWLKVELPSAIRCLAGKSLSNVHVVEAQTLCRRSLLPGCHGEPRRYLSNPK
jgi:hypothetical protein